MLSTVLRAYKYRFYPSPEQVEQFSQTFGCARFIYNHFLSLKTAAWKEQEKSLSYGDCSKLLSRLKEEYGWLKEVSSVCLQQSLRHLHKAFEGFFAKRARYPKFKSKHGTQSVTYMRNAFTYKNGQIILAKQREPLNIRWSRKLGGIPSSLTITLDSAGRYHIAIHVEEKVQSLPFVKQTIGIDLGLTNQVQDSLGQSILRPNFLDKRLKRLKRLQQKLSRKVRGSNNRQKMRRKVARQHMRVRDQRLDFLHKVSWKLVCENQVIAAESLGVKEMAKDNRLARHIADAAWSTLLRFLSYKCQWYGRTFVQVGQYFPSSKLCYGCGFQSEEMPLHKRSWDCPSCKSHHDRDTNAARNILKEGLRILGVPWGARDLKPVECV